MKHFERTKAALDDAPDYDLKGRDWLPGAMLFPAVTAEGPVEETPPWEEAPEAEEEPDAEADEIADEAALSDDEPAFDHAA